jgi:hypothetical protein
MYHMHYGQMPTSRPRRTQETHSGQRIRRPGPVPRKAQQAQRVPAYVRTLMDNRDTHPVPWLNAQASGASGPPV